MPRPTDLVYLREPRRRTLLAQVTATRGPYFLLDTTIFAPTSHAYRHPQPADRGEIWFGGDKRILTKVVWDRGEVRHSVRGTTPHVGATARCLLEAGRRDDASRAHLALHLVLSVFSRRRLGVLTREPEAQGGRGFVLTARWNAWSPAALKDVMDAANAAAAAKHEVAYEYMPRNAARGIDEQPFEDGVTLPGPDVLRVVRVGGASALPCDGTFPERTSGLGRIVARSVHPGREGVRIQFRVE